jgi:hypothetical protein
MRARQGQSTPTHHPQLQPGQEKLQGMRTLLPQVAQCPAHLEGPTPEEATSTRCRIIRWVLMSPCPPAFSRTPQSGPLTRKVKCPTCEAAEVRPAPSIRRATRHNPRRQSPRPSKAVSMPRWNQAQPLNPRWVRTRPRVQLRKNCGMCSRGEGRGRLRGPLPRRRQALRPRSRSIEKANHRITVALWLRGTRASRALPSRVKTAHEGPRSRIFRSRSCIRRRSKNLRKGGRLGKGQVGNVKGCGCLSSPTAAFEPQLGARTPETVRHCSLTFRRSQADRPFVERSYSLAVVFIN